MRISLLYSTLLNSARVFSIFIYSLLFPPNLLFFSILFLSFLLTLFHTDPPELPRQAWEIDIWTIFCLCPQVRYTEHQEFWSIRILNLFTQAVWFENWQLSYCSNFWCMSLTSIERVLLEGAFTCCCDFPISSSPSNCRFKSYLIFLHLLWRPFFPCGLWLFIWPRPETLPSPCPFYGRDVGCHGRSRPPGVSEVPVPLLQV